MGSRLLFNLHEQMIMSQEGNSELSDTHNQLINFEKIHFPAPTEGDDHFIQTIRDSTELADLEDVRGRSNSILVGSEKDGDIEQALARRRRSYPMADDASRSCEVISGSDDDCKTLDLQWSTPPLSNVYEA